jgi:ubiquinone/menaquinone biosynthesis C-methylase UbiE
MMIMLNYENLVDPLLRDIRKFTPDFAGMKVGDRVLDVCCGTGEQVFEYGRNGIIATGIDIDPNMLKIALKNMAKNNLENVSFQQADAINLPFSDFHFDCASISFGLHDKGRIAREQVVSEMKRIVKPNGTLILIDFQVPLPTNMWALFARVIEFLVNGDHYRGFKDYLRSGGINNLINTNHLHEVDRVLLKNGLIIAVRVVKS